MWGEWLWLWLIGLVWVSLRVGCVLLDALVFILIVLSESDRARLHALWSASRDWPLDVLWHGDSDGGTLHCHIGHHISGTGREATLTLTIGQGEDDRLAMTGARLRANRLVRIGWLRWRLLGVSEDGIREEQAR